MASRGVTTRSGANHDQAGEGSNEAEEFQDSVTDILVAADDSVHEEAAPSAAQVTMEQHQSQPMGRRPLKIPRPKPFCKRGDDLHTFLSQAQAYVESMEGTDSQKGTLLLTCVEGPAHNMLRRAGYTEAPSCRAILAELWRVYATEETAVNLRHELDNLQQLPAESFEELQVRITYLTSKVYAAARRPSEEVQRDMWINALRDGGHQRRARKLRMLSESIPLSDIIADLRRREHLAAAPAAAATRDGATSSSPSAPPPPPQQVQPPPPPPAQPASTPRQPGASLLPAAPPPPASTALQEQVQNLTKMVADLHRQMHSDTADRIGRQPRRRRNAPPGTTDVAQPAGPASSPATPGNCYRCGLSGHFAIGCTAKCARCGRKAHVGKACAAQQQPAPTATPPTTQLATMPPSPPAGNANELPAWRGEEARI